MKVRLKVRLSRGSQPTLRLLALTAFLSQAVVLSQAGQAQLEQGQLNSKYPMGIPPAVKPHAWLAQAWTGDDAPYVRMEEDVCGKIRTGQPVQTVLAQARANALKHPLDFAPQFRWLYATTLAAGDSDNVDYRALEAVARADPGNIRTVACIRFAAGVLIDQNQSHPDLDRIGERLLRADPSDRWVRVHLIYDLANSRPTLPQARAMAEAFVAEEPTNCRAHSVLGLVYETIWAASGHRRVFAEKAITEYQAFLRLAPPNDPFRHDAQYLVNGFRKRLATSIP